VLAQPISEGPGSSAGRSNGELTSPYARSDAGTHASATNHAPMGLPAAKRDAQQVEAVLQRFSAGLEQVLGETNRCAQPISRLSSVHRLSLPMPRGPMHRPEAEASSALAQRSACVYIEGCALRSCACRAPVLPWAASIVSQPDMHLPRRHVWGSRRLMSAAQYSVTLKGNQRCTPQYTPFSCVCPQASGSRGGQGRRPVGGRERSARTIPWRCDLIERTIGQPRGGDAGGGARAADGARQAGAGRNARRALTPLCEGGGHAVHKCSHVSPPHCAPYSYKMRARSQSLSLAWVRML